MEWQEQTRILQRSIEIKYKVLKALGRKPSTGAPVLDLQLSAFGPKMFPRTNLPRRKVMIYFCQKGKKMGGLRLRFGENMPRKIS